MSFDTCVFLIGLIMTIIILAAFLPFLFLADPVEDNNSNDENSFSTAKRPDNYEYDWRKNSFGKPRIE